MIDRAAVEIWHQAVSWHGLDMIPRLRAMTPAERMRVMHEANEHNSVEPLWLVAAERRFLVPSWDSKPVTGAQVAALLVFGLWVHVGEREEVASGLVKDWPFLKTVSMLVDKGVKRTADAVCT
jgi:hypothetical protein